MQEEKVTKEGRRGSFSLLLLFLGGSGDFAIPLLSLTAPPSLPLPPPPSFRSAS